MIEEIIYTSAPKGLKAGSRGFCTVVSTAGMAVNTAERLESMSGYRHAFPMQDPKAVLNPVSYSHVTLRIGGRNVHVISRVADAGQDYSGRTNKLAHHLVIDDVSRLIAGPVRLMAETGVLVSQWDGNTRNVPPRKLPSPAIPQSIELQAWESVTGDSGWAGWVAEQLTKDKTPVSVIFAAGTDTFSLVREVLDLLPPAQRWSITFSTYFTKLLAGTECQLRFVLDDTPEATALKNDARAKLVDLTSTLKPAIGGPIVTQARGGRIVAVDSPPPVQRPAAPGRPAASSRVEQAPVVEDMDIEIPALRGTKPAMPGFQSPTLPPAIANPFNFNQERPTKKRSSGWWKYLVGAIVLVASSSLITFFVMKQMNHGPETKNVGGGVHVVSQQGKADAQEDKPTDRKTDVAGTGTGKDTSAAMPGEFIVESKPDKAPPAKKDVPASETLTKADEGEAPSKSAPPDTPKPQQEEKFDPFRLVLNDPQFLYPNHKDLLLFELPARTEDSRIGTPPAPMPLVLREGDTIHLSFHQTFKHLILDRIDDGKKGPDIRLTESSAADAKAKSWKAALFQENSEFLEFGTYALNPILENPSSNGPSHSLEFTPGTLCNSKKVGEHDSANLFRFCPLVVSIARDSQRPESAVFCQTRGEKKNCTQGAGNWKPAENTSYNPFGRLAILESSPKPPWKGACEVVILASNKKREVGVIPFVDRDKASRIRRDKAIGTLFRRIPDSSENDRTELSLSNTSDELDGDFGFVNCDFEWQFIPVDAPDSRSVISNFSMSQKQTAVFRLPRLVDPSDKKGTAMLPYLDLLNRATIFTTDGKWRDEMNDPLTSDNRLQLSAIAEKDEDNKNFAELKSKVDELKRSFSSEKNKYEEQTKLKTDELKKAKADEAGNVQKVIDECQLKISEIDNRVNVLDGLLSKYSDEEHCKQYAAYNSFHERDKTERIGFEVSIELDACKFGDIEQPKAKFYLIETQFVGEK